MILLAQAAQPDPISPLLQYGALGILAALAVIAVRVLFVRLVAELDLQRARADRMEASLGQLNTAIQERYMMTLAEASHATAEATRVIGEFMAARRSN